MECTERPTDAGASPAVEPIPTRRTSTTPADREDVSQPADAGNVSSPAKPSAVPSTSAESPKPAGESWRKLKVSNMNLDDALDQKFKLKTLRVQQAEQAARTDLARDIKFELECSHNSCYESCPTCNPRLAGVAVFDFAFHAPGRPLSPSEGVSAGQETDGSLDCDSDDCTDDDDDDEGSDDDDDDDDDDRESENVDGDGDVAMSCPDDDAVESAHAGVADVVMADAPAELEPATQAGDIVLPDADADVVAEAEAEAPKPPVEPNTSRFRFRSWSGIRKRCWPDRPLAWVTGSSSCLPLGWVRRRPKPGEAIG